MSEVEEYYRNWSAKQPREIYTGGRSAGRKWKVMLKFAEAYHEYKIKLNNE